MIFLAELEHPPGYLQSSPGICNILSVTKPHILRRRWSSGYSSEIFDFVFTLSFKIFILIYQWVLQIKVFEGSNTLIQVRTSWNQLTLKLQTLARLFHLDYFAKYWQMFLELHCILKDCIKVQEKKKKVVVLCSRPRQRVNLGTFTLKSWNDGKEMQKQSTYKVVVLLI